MKPPADLPLELVLLAEAFARRLEMPVGDFWAVLYRKKAPPPGWAAAWADAFAPLGDGLLTSRHNLATVATTMSTADVPDNRQTRVSRARMRKDNRKHPFVAALVAIGATVTEAAAALGYPRSTVQSWYDSDTDNARPVPQRAVDALAAGIRIGDRILKVPASAWRRVAE